MDNSKLSKCSDILNYSAVKLEQDLISFDVHYWGIDPLHRDNPVHKHSFFEICYVLDGVGTYMDNGTVFALHKDTLFMSRPNIRHQIRSEAGMFLLFVAFEVNESKSEEPMIRYYQNLAVSENFVLPESGHTSSALAWRALLEQLQHPDSMMEPFVKSAAHSLLVSFHSTFGDHARSENEWPSPKPSVHLFNRAIRFMKDNLSQSLTLEDVAGYLHVSSRHLSRLFQQELGMSYIDFVQQEKMRRAVHLLNHTELSTRDIAEKTGFNSVHYFTRSFTKLMGMPPGKYRNRQ